MINYLKGRVASKTIDTLSGRAFFCENDLIGFTEVENMIFIAKDTSISDVSTIKKAAAVLTEHGGILSHAAIVCRELSVPCIVAVDGIYEYTNVGDMLDIDFNSGTIKITKGNNTNA